MKAELYTFAACKSLARFSYGSFLSQLHPNTS